MRRLLIAAAVSTTVGLAALPAGASAQTGCGGLLQPKCPPATTPTPAPAAPPPLETGRYNAIDPVLTAAAKLESDDATDADVDTYRSACTALSTADPVTAGIHGVCAVQISVATFDPSGVAKCKSARSCAKAIAPLGRVVTRLARAETTANKAIAPAVADPECRTALLTPAADVKSERALGAAVKRLVKARTHKQQASALKRFGTATKAADPRSATDQLSAFHAGCAAGT